MFVKDVSTRKMGFLTLMRCMISCLLLLLLTFSRSAALTPLVSSSFFSASLIVVAFAIAPLWTPSATAGGLVLLASMSAAKRLICKKPPWLRPQIEVKNARTCISVTGSRATQIVSRLVYSPVPEGVTNEATETVSLLMYQIRP